MKPKYYIMNLDTFLGTIYEKNGHKIIFLYEQDINLEYGLRILDINNKPMQDEEVEDILVDFFLGKNNGW